ncbi:MAG: hypothetical protein LQ352_006870 [Teloschistes flavicans]|nr:MAG: hypothetical protein LQ352_006870 [Teloschistes flavicans]
MSSKSKSKGPKKSHPSHTEKAPGIPQPDRFKTTVSIVQACSLVGLTIVTTNLLQSSISPVYGSLAANQYHDRLIISALFLAGLTHRWLNGSGQSWAQLLAVLLLSVPSAVFFLAQFSRQLGPRLGPLITGLVSTLPLTLISAIAACKRRGLRNNGVSSSNVDRQWTSYEIITSLAVVASFTSHWFSATLQQWMRNYISDSKLLCYYLLALFQASLFPSKYLLLAAFPTLHTVLYTAHIPSTYTNGLLNATLHNHGYSLVARQESVTGYISVLDNAKDGFRVMRCDHSLLGGEWHPPPGKQSGMREPVYAIFVMLEAVRLVQSAARPSPPAYDSTQKEAQENALVIGLGIGTTPSALIAHGIDTTILEIDPTVHAFAIKYFNLPSNHTSIIQDATLWVDDHTTNTKNHSTYNYIIHDVFTGGAEPIDLFTAEFLHRLKDLLKADGVIAINYAGDLNLPTAARVVRTVLEVFPTCRLFREEPAPTTTATTKNAGRRATLPDFTNMVLFCRKVPGAFTFRKPTEADYLGSGAREYALLPRHEVDSSSFFPPSAENVEGEGEEDVIIRKKNTRRKEVEKAQLESAMGHWGVMRSVLPDAVWENW